jgi:hypothetical protein
VIAHSDT